MSFSIKTPNPGDSRKKFFGIELARQLTQKTTQTPELGINADKSQYGEIFGQIPEEADETEINPFEAVIITGDYYWAPDITIRRNRIVRCYKFNEPLPEYREWGIALDLITTEKSGRILMFGVQWLDTSSLTTPPATASHINVVEGALVPGYNGRASVLQTLTTPMCLVELSGHRQSLMGYTKPGGLSTGSEGSVFYRKQISSGWTVTTIEIPAWCTESNIPGNTNVRLDPTEGRYHAVKLCP